MKYLKLLSVLAIGALTAISWQAYAAYVWFPAPTNPPACTDPNIPGCNAPLNVGPLEQTKTGSLKLEKGLQVNTSLDRALTYGLQVWGISRFWGGISIPTGAATGKVLTAVDSSGLVEWDDAGVSTCPSGFTSLSNGHCIETNPRSATTWYSAATTCVNNGASMCSPSTWYGACSTSKITNTTTEWLDNIDDAGDSWDMKARVGLGSCSINNSSYSMFSSVQYRCCI